MNLEPGIYRATVRDVPDQTVIRVSEMIGKWWISAASIEGGRWHDDSQVTDARPLTLIDIGDNSPLVVRALTFAAKDPTNGDARVIFRNLADQIEAQHAPPRIPEPGLWGVVEANLAHSGERFPFIHYEHGWGARASHICHWSELKDPVLIRDGIEGTP